jgi:3-dehydroquinate synthase
MNETNQTPDNSQLPERIVQVDTPPRPYPVIIGPGVLGTLGTRLAEQFTARRAMIVTDENVGPLYAPPVLMALQKEGFTTHLETVPAGDSTKCLAMLSTLYDSAAKAGIDRSCPVIALGGGVIGDLTGFLAATWMRGVPFIQCATTIEADVDASVGGKTAVNHPSGKNMIGSFYQPRMVLIDTITLKTLSERDFRAGLAESVKHAVIRDHDFFTWHEKEAEEIVSCNLEALGALIERNVQIKADVVAQDEREETGIRALLNFGHTIGHAVETAMARREQPWRHGEAVAAGMVAAAEVSIAAGRLDRESADRIEQLLQRLGLPIRAPLAGNREELLELMQHDKKVAAGKLRFVLADAIGQSGLYDNIEPVWIKKGLDRILTEA